MHQNIEVKFQGKVISGEAVGRTIGFPTANLDYIPTEKELLLGVYVGSCVINDESQPYDCLIYFGPRFILGKTQNSFEIYLYEFQGDLYGKNLTIQVQQFIRPPVKFSNLEALKTQLQKDLEHGRLLLNHGKSKL
jgi:riboflavin kinase/FMN adenylyltransferase